MRTGAENPEQLAQAAAPTALDTALEPAHPRPEAIRTRPVLGVPLAMTDYDEAMDVMDGMIARGQRGYVFAVAVHAVTVAHRDAEMREALLGSSLTVPDGMPLVWAANILGEKLEHRVYGPELMRRYTQRCAQRAHRVWLYGGRDQGSLAQLALNMRRENPGLQIVGGYSPPFRELTRAEEDDVVAQINADKPDVLWVGTGVPRQEKWTARLRERLDVPVICAVGAAFDFHAGRVSQAPSWMQDRGLEWTYRIAQEPRRLLPRYLYYNPAFVLAFARQLFREKLRRKTS
ncbi:MAG: N-acetylglucosaminyldiphosphoundecaprenol N-acetyl-beta-D-mannosaminyltransferase [Thermoleophilaceae bacterium]|jgi:N-acetylglucosaminyldiphosphoundecaprenol N-acetyl-beta-D-mannosaminyltransferase|nr:N-acetylglucosaminyldiphosphoundecaprenol N-acetyl-beta-D-mannosaminyltransferase [Thermoleophilaceae bacterium]